MKCLRFAVLIFLFFLVACNSRTFTKGEPIKKEINIAFDSLSKINNDWFSFKIEKDDETNVTFSKGQVVGNVYKISAKANAQKNGPIIIAVSSKKIGKHHFSLTFDTCSEYIEPVFTSKTSLQLQYEVQSLFSKYLAPFIGGCILFISIVSILYSIAKRRKSFNKGRILFEIPITKQVLLFGKRIVNLAKIPESQKATFFCVLICRLSYLYQGRKSIVKKKALLVVNALYEIKVNESETYEPANTDNPIKTPVKVNCVYLENEDVIEICKDGQTIIKFHYYS